ncbi:MULTISPECIES: hypothetical protein [unclassified Curtobacterium]|uniref:hypothetical protein n=1 Tax=unclassified Curtobacterium TaxID=257496 RepID=UPI003A80B4D0
MAELTWVELIIPAASGVVGAAIGSLGTVFGHWWANAGALRREQIARDAARAAAKHAERRAFEIETFSRLPDLVHGHVRMRMRLLLADESALITSGLLTSNHPAGGEEGLAVSAELMLVTNRILDDDLREQLHTMRMEMTDVTRIERPIRADQIVAECDRRRSRLGELADSALVLVTTHQRALYRDEPAT